MNISAVYGKNFQYEFNRSLKRALLEEKKLNELR